MTERSFAASAIPQYLLYLTLLLYCVLKILFGILLLVQNKSSESAVL